MWDLIVLIPDHCLSIYFKQLQYEACKVMDRAKVFRLTFELMFDNI